MKPLNHCFQNCKLFFQNRLNRYREINRDPNMTQHKHAYAICCRPEVTGDVISSETVKTFDGYALLNFEVASISSVRAIPKKNIS